MTATAAILCNDARFDQESQPWQLHVDPGIEASAFINSGGGKQASGDPASTFKTTPRLAEIPV